MFVKPGPNKNGPGGLHAVRFPRTHELLQPAGREVPDNRFWMRRVRAGDVVLAEPEASPAAAAAPAVEEPAAPEAPAATHSEGHAS